MRELRSLKASHKQGIRLIVAGMPVKDAAALIGVSDTYMSTVYRSDLGREYMMKLHDLADNYVACMLALGLVPQDILQSDAPNKRPERIVREAMSRSKARLNRVDKSNPFR